MNCAIVKKLFEIKENEFLFDSLVKGEKIDNFLKSKLGMGCAAGFLVSLVYWFGFC